MAKIIIIGGGVSGLSAGIYAQMQGHSATVCESHSIPGGNLTSWRRGEYEIDNCIHWLTGTNPSSPLFDVWRDLGALGMSVKIHRTDSLYTCRLNGQKLSLVRDLDSLKRRMISISEVDEKEISSMIAAVKLIQRLSKIGGDLHREGLNASSLARIPLLAKYYPLTVRELSMKFKHPLLKEFIASFWEDDFGALALLFVFAHFCGENADLPHLGSRGMAERMAEKFSALGGELLLKKEAVRVNHFGGKAREVVFADGSSLSADYIIVTVDPASFFGKIIDHPMPKQLKKLYESPKLKRFSSVQCAFGVKAADLNFSGDLIVGVPQDKRETIGASRLILREFSHESSYAPEGETVLQCMAFCDEKQSQELISAAKNRKSDYHSFKNRFATACKEIIRESISNSNATLKLLDVWTPATYKRFTNSEIGSYMSFVLPSGMLPHRKSNRVSGLSNLILATQWQQCPGGLPVAAIGGKNAAETVTRLEKATVRARVRKPVPQTVIIN